ncbi:MAG: hypothetical protein IPI67_39640 [Myxococcales bacterium]|nr:hypothetical protein [Myxococcales bacterium]
MPRLVEASGLLLASTGLLAGFTQLPGAPVFALVVLAAAATPWRGSSRHRAWGVALAYAVLAWSLFGLAPFVTVGENLGGPYGGSALTFAFALLAAAFRVFALTREAAKLWTAPRWVLGASATPMDAEEAVRAALLSGSEQRERALEVAVYASTCRRSCSSARRAKRPRITTTIAVSTSPATEAARP